jgi:hypothetical protein
VWQLEAIVPDGWVLFSLFGGVFGPAVLDRILQQLLWVRKEEKIKFDIDVSICCIVLNLLYAIIDIYLPVVQYFVRRESMIVAPAR